MSGWQSPSRGLGDVYKRQVDERLADVPIKVQAACKRCERSAGKGGVGTQAVFALHHADSAAGV